ncbi:DUF998 domain-containing protein [Paractinoplanes lichenicola]|uniref:DUF998 domain-containing protein n=1 Tax=Paractinoplanes lichenicola TaxID=2802976 RepID=A0ABS1VFJ9_9ACTN|nr:DUF998 domain-containing protein [Actinoplanes lichenicola]MBL7252944.1 DUF998 domain-containing protein [Actinoplanes lichenicola]
MTTATVQARTSRWYRHTQLSLALATVAGAGLLVVGHVDPMNQMLSDSISTVPGAVLLALAACGLAAAGAWLLAGARRALPRSGLLTVLLGAWSVSLLALAVFPTNLPGTEAGPAAVIHRVGAGAMAALPPLIALLVAHLAGRREVTGRVRALWAAGWSAVTACLAFAVVNGPAVLLDQSLPPYAGLAERILLALVLVVVGLCAWVLEGEERSRWT